MEKAYLQNKKAQYYFIADEGTIELGDDKKPLQQVPELVDAVEELASTRQKYKDLPKTGFIFRNDGLRILS